MVAQFDKLIAIERTISVHTLLIIMPIISKTYEQYGKKSLDLKNMRQKADGIYCVTRLCSAFKSSKR
jgi:hypothetical protein